jgi:hypothetical protein
MTRQLSRSLRGPVHAAFAATAPTLIALITAVACATALPAFAQDAPDAVVDAGTDSAPAHISFVDGNAILERDGKPDSSPLSMPLLAGDRVRTTTGRVEVLFADGSVLHVDNHTVVDFQSDEVVRLVEGRMRLAIAGRGRDVGYRVDAPGGWVQVVEAGEYRIAVLREERDPQVELAVLRGAAELVNEDGRTLVRAGERAFARLGAQPSPPYVFNSAAWDAFDRWSETRRDQRLGVSAQYLPPDVQPYSAAFDHYGSWRYEQAHGYVWYPRVDVGWRPYYRGRWVSLRPYGWTWIAGDPWGWPTHHYGRWGLSGGSWFWIPGRRWGAAWVSWAYAPDYVSWCPLGWNNRPVFSFFSVNIHSNRNRYYDPWRAWTLVPRRHFGSGFVNVHHVYGGRLDHRTRGGFVLRNTAPEWRYAVPRASAPIRTAGRSGYAVPRGSGYGAAAGAATRESAGPDGRRFPSPSREPRASIAGRDRPAGQSSAPVTSAPQRAVPRDRTAPRDTFSTAPEASRSSRPEFRRSPESVQPDSRRRADSVTIPSPRPDRDDAGEGRSRAVPGYRSAPDDGRAAERYRAVPRQDAPRPSYERPRESPRSYEMPSRSSGGESRSYGAPSRGESQPSRSSGAPPERRGSSGGDRASRPAPSGDGGGQSRSRGSQPSQGQARPRGGR